MKQIARERFETAWLSNPEIFSVHELPDCSDHAFYATMAEADADTSSLVKSLDGAWKAHFAMNPSEAPDTLLTSAALDETLREIQVPCEFQMEAPEWDPPHYVNTQYPLCPCRRCSSVPCCIWRAWKQRCWSTSTGMKSAMRRTASHRTAST